MATSWPQSFLQCSLDVTLRPYTTFETFIHPDKNELLPGLKNLAKSTTEPRQYFLWGTAQTGKSHLLQAVCNQLAYTDRKAVYLPIEELAIADSHVLNNLHQLDVVCLDNIDHVLGDEEWDRAFFLLINELRAENRSLVVTASLRPNDIKISLPDLASRLVWGPVYKLRPLTDKQKETALRMQAKARGFEISLEVCSYLLRRYPRELSKLVELLDQLDRQSLSQQRKITIPFVKLILDKT